MSQKPTNDRKIILITGGQRSGKSLYAEQMALALSAHPIYLATARIWDDEFAQRVAVHRERRGSEWTNMEEEKVLSRHNPLGEVILIDCLTLWATNYFFDNDSDVELSYAALCAEFDSFTSHSGTFIFVTNEIGLGGVAENALQRHFADLLGRLNQYVAARADRVVLMISGIPMVIKGD